MSDYDRTYTSEKNSPFRRGIVTEREKGRVKVRFDDEDEVSSFWLHVPSRGTGANKDWSMPNVGEQVGCLVDWDGEDGCVLGGLWSDKDTPPTDDPDVEHRKYESGLETIVNRKTGDITVKGANSMDIEAATITLKGNVAIEGDSLTHNGKNVGDDHEHTDVKAGADLTGPPA